MPVNRSEPIPVNIVGSSTFGRCPKISLEKTYNMFISDDWLINYAGFQAVLQLFSAGEGRGIFHSVRGNFAIVVIGNQIFRIDDQLVPNFIGNINTTNGEVSIDENLSSQIAIADGESLWIYSYITNMLTKQTLIYLGNPVLPSYVSYINTFFLLGSNPVSINPQLWYAAKFDTDNTVIIDPKDSFPIQTKPDFALAVKRIPGKGNNVIAFGSTVAEIWTQVGGSENFRRIQSFNIDYGCVSIDTIAASDSFVVWLSQNENNAPSIMMTDGAATKRISSDGIDYLLQSIKKPNESTAFCYRQDGHLFYQLTFFNHEDNLSLVYDFNTEKFFHISDEKLNYHPARQVIYFMEKTYFVSINDATIYEASTNYVTYNYSLDKFEVGEIIPRIRICKTIRKKDSSRFRIGQFRFWIEQGVNNYMSNNNRGYVLTEEGGYALQEGGMAKILLEGSVIPNGTDGPRVDMSFSVNGNQSFSNIVSRPLNFKGNYRNQITWWRMGQANEFTPQLRFWGVQRFVCQDGVLEVY